MREPRQPDSQVSTQRAATDVPAPKENRRLSVAHFLIALLLLLATLPFVDDLPYAELIEVVLITLMLLSALLAVGGRRRTFSTAVVLVAFAVAGKWFDHLRPDLIPRAVTSGASLVFVAFVIAHLIRFIVRAPQVNSEVLCAGVATYLMLAILWSFAYTLVAQLAPDSFRFTIESDADHNMAGFHSLYFSFSTLTTVDFGDIIPVSRVARTLAMAEAVTGVFYLAVMVARLVSLYSRNGRAP